MPDISSHPFLLLVFPISLFAIITHPFSHLRNLVSYLTLPFMTTKSSSYVINFTPKLFLLFFSTALIQATITFSWATRLMLYPDFPIQICPTSVHFLHNIFQNLLELYIFFSQEKKKTPQNINKAHQVFPFLTSPGSSLWFTSVRLASRTFVSGCSPSYIELSVVFLALNELSLLFVFPCPASPVNDILQASLS